MRYPTTIAVGIMAVFVGLCMAQDTKPEPKELVFEDRPLRTWLEELYSYKEPPAGGNIKNVLAETERAEAALRRFCAKPERAVPALTAALADKNEYVREAVVICLGDYCKTEAKSLIPALRKALREDKSAAVRRLALIALAHVGPRDDGVATALVQALQEDKDESVREAAVHCLCDDCRIDAKSLISILRKALREDKSEFVRRKAVYALADFGRFRAHDEAVTTALLQALQEDKDGDVREAAINTLLIVKPAKPAILIPGLKAALKDKEVGVRIQAVLVVRDLIEPKVAIPMLLGNLIDDEFDMRLRLSGPGISPPVSGYAVEALGHLCPEAIPALFETLNDKNPRMRSGALRALASAKASARPLIHKELPTILLLLEDKDAAVRAAAAGLLGRVRAGDAVPALVAKLDDKNEWVSLACMTALGRIGPEAAPAATKLTIRLQDRKAKGRCEAAQALGRIGPKARVAVPVLITALEDDDTELRCHAARALGEIGPDAVAAIPKLKEASRAEDGELRHNATEALKKIGAE